MDESRDPATELTDADISVPAHRALTSGAADVLRDRAKPQAAAEIAAEENATAAHETPLNAYMIDPKYLYRGEPEARPVHESQPEPALQGAGQGETKNFYSALAVPMAAGRIRRPRGDTQMDEEQIHADAPVHETAEPAAAKRPEKDSVGNSPLFARMTAGSVGILAVLAAKSQALRSTLARHWQRFRFQHHGVSYTMAEGAHRRGIAGMKPSIPVVLPLLAILSVLAAGAVTGTFEGPKVSPGNPSTSTPSDGTTQNGTAGPGSGTSTNGNGSTSTTPTSGTGQAAPNGTSLPVGGRGAGEPSTSSSSGTSSTSSPSSSATGTSGASDPSTGISLPVGGRGAGDEAITVPDAQLTPTTPGLPVK